MIVADGLNGGDDRIEVRQDPNRKLAIQYDCISSISFGIGPAGE